jgi:hypothetical protein
LQARPSRRRHGCKKEPRATLRDITPKLCSFLLRRLDVLDVITRQHGGVLFGFFWAGYLFIWLGHAIGALVVLLADHALTTTGSRLRRDLPLGHISWIGRQWL